MPWNNLHFMSIIPRHCAEHHNKRSEYLSPVRKKVSVMDVFDISSTRHYRANDNTILGEVFHPLRLKKALSARYSIAHAQVPPGERTLPHKLLRSSEVYVILSGSGIMHVDSEIKTVFPGMIIYIPPGSNQWIENFGEEDISFLAICDPFWKEADEIIGVTEDQQDHGYSLFMDEAIKEAKTGRAEGGIPIGSVLVRNGDVIGRGHNRRVQNSDPMSHAEIDCLKNAGRISSYGNCILYSTLMPCYLCAGAIVQFGIRDVIVGESRTFYGAREFMEAYGVRVSDLDLIVCREMMKAFIKDEPDLWNEDIGAE